MTAQIVIMNRSAVALASDSAVTIGDGEKIYNSANKIFSISKMHSAGLMIYNTMTFLEIPWETLIKMFRKYIEYEVHDTLEDYGNSFINFLNSGVINVNLQLAHIQIKASYCVRELESDMKKAMNTESVTCSSFILETKNIMLEIDLLNDATFDDVDEFVSLYRSTIHELIVYYFSDYELSNEDIINLIDIVSIYFYSGNFEYESTTGVVFTGFGDNDIFPSTVVYTIGGYSTNVRYRREGEFIIDGINNNSEIIPFAQSEMVNRYLLGLDPILKKETIKLLDNLIDEYALKLTGLLECDIPEESQNTLLELKTELLENFDAEINKYQTEHFGQPIHEIIRNLPHDELANMAETLITLSSFKRKVSRDKETVGGPIDVAVITKGDGFIWIKRKHYFSTDLNPDFLKR